MDDNSAFLEEVFENLLMISRGECNITEEDLLALEAAPQKLNILSGLKLLFEDLELYKKEYRENLEAEYRLKVLEKKNEDLEQFNYMASHDLKEPLRNIKNFSQLLLNSHEQLPTEKVTDYLTHITSATGRMYDLLNGLLNFTTAGSTLVKTHVNMVELIDVVKADVILANEALTIDFEIEPMPTIYVDSAAIHIVIQNLITNAIKFRDKKRKLCLKVKYKAADTHHQFCISDNGIGIQKEYLNDIFVLLKRLHTKAEIEGSGIGLSTCKKIIEMHNGKMWVESIYGKGSDFFFTIPR